MTQLRGGASAPANPFPLLVLRSVVLFPGAVLTVPIGRPRSLALLATLGPGSIIGVATQRDTETNDPQLQDLHTVGTFARVHRITRVSDREARLSLEGIGRFELNNRTRIDPFWLVEGSPIQETGTLDPIAKQDARTLHHQVEEIATKTGVHLDALANADDEPGVLADQIAAFLGLSLERQFELISIRDVPARIRRVTELLGEANVVSEIRRKIDGDVRREVNKHQREALLREQLRAIQRELGDEGGPNDLQALRDKLDKAGLSDDARSVANRELKRLEALQPQNAEYNVIRTYLEWIAELPWSKRAEASVDVDAVAKQLDADHHGLDDVKRRILEHMAVLRLGGQARGTILCLAGPPGVGKTSLGQSIATATGRPFIRIALGGVRDEADVRGHRRTYVGALPGRIIHAMKKAGVKNPVVLLDEVDKLTLGWQGSPESALLEVLDPEQNKTFTDHYLDIPFDLSEVLFVCTANDLGNLSAPLRDRLEIIEVSGYTIDEKLHIARQHLLPRALKEHAIPEGKLSVSDDAIRSIASDYTREAGVRQLNREITKLCRALALDVVRRGEQSEPLHVEPPILGKYLGKVKFFNDVAERVSIPGVATGLAWTPVGGDILFIETTRMPGKGRIEITGQLGDVMKESARAALSYVRGRAETLGVDPAFLESQDLHIHVPAGAVPKDGPSAGVTMFTALTSLLSGRCVRSDTAMTGECTLRGRVLPVGGIKGKVLAAHRAGLRRVILPAKNRRDLEDVPEQARRELEFIFADDMSEVLQAALEPMVKTPPAEAGGSNERRSEGTSSTEIIAS